MARPPPRDPAAEADRDDGRFADAPCDHDPPPPNVMLAAPPLGRRRRESDGRGKRSVFNHKGGLMKPLLPVAIIAFCLIGCAGRSTTDFTAGPFRDAPRSLGRAVVLVRCLFPGSGKAEADKQDHVRDIVEEIFAAVPEAEIVPEESFRAALGPKDWQDFGDLELSMAARSCGLDTVAVVSVERYRGELTLSLLPPYWATETSFRYRVRLVDANAGELLMEAYRGVKTGGPFSARDSKDLDEDFRRNLADLLGAPQPAAGRT